jgi:hypothetical protein
MAPSVSNITIHPFLAEIKRGAAGGSLMALDFTRMKKISINGPRKETNA